MLDFTYLSANMPVDISFGLGALIRNESGTVSKIKAFVWSSLTGMEALSEVVQYPQ
ncbi:MAG TPA: hypothetical protein VFF80_04415 [Bacillota bacterium]|nr:hypothetical protein [Bacillota bacterium]